MVDCYGQPLLDAVASGQIGTVLVDRALERVLSQKCELGLLDPDWSAEPPLLREGEGDRALDDAPSRSARPGDRPAIARAACPTPGYCRSSPAPGWLWSVHGRMSPGAMLGDYSFPMHAGRHFPDVPMGVAVPTLREVLAQDPAGYDLSFAQGCSVTEGSDEEIAEAARVAAKSDVCIAVLGDHASLFGGGTSGEGCDAVDLRLPGRQGELLEALLATGTPVVLVLLVGRPYDISPSPAAWPRPYAASFPARRGPRP